MYAGRIRITVRYDGTGFHGSQFQPGKRTVAGTLKTGLGSILRREPHLLFAGRTDAGVHADGNVCAFDAELPFPVLHLSRILNAVLPDDIRVRDSAGAPPQFHPRFDAIARTYEYCIFHGNDVPVDRMRYVMACSGNWDDGALKKALSAVAGQHAFHCFAEGTLEPRYAQCRLEPVVLRCQPPETWLVFKGDRFLRQMVRRLVGALCEVAAGRVSPAQFTAAVSGVMDFQFKPAPACGLVLKQVDYGL